MEADFCDKALKETIAKYGKPEIMNSDQGNQFTGFEWTQALKNVD
jgi:putative transposase